MTRGSGTGCAAPSALCGTPAGWREGGRCWRCRTAHNAESTRNQGLSQEQRADVLASLNDGHGAEEAAARAGVSLRRVSGFAATDGELRAALDGMPQPVQRAARLGDYLAALVRTGGAADMACLIVGVDEAAIQERREQEAGFAAAEQGVLRWLEGAVRVPVRSVGEVGDAELDEAAALLEGGAPVSRAARAVGLSMKGLRRAAWRHPRLAAAIPTPDDLDAQFRELWAADATYREICQAMGLSHSNVSAWRERLGLPARTPGVRGKRTAATDAQFRELWTAGVSRRQIMKELAITEPTLYAWQERLELPLRSPVGEVSDAELDTAAALLEEGAPVGEAARAVGLTMTRLRRAAKRHPRLAAAIPTPDDLDAQFRELWAADATWQEICLTMGLSRPSVGAWRERLGLPARRRSNRTGHEPVEQAP